MPLPPNMYSATAPRTGETVRVVLADRYAAYDVTGEVKGLHRGGETVTIYTWQLAENPEIGTPVEEEVTKPDPDAKTPNTPPAPKGSKATSTAKTPDTPPAAEGVA